MMRSEKHSVEVDWFRHYKWEGGKLYILEIWVGISFILGTFIFLPFTSRSQRETWNRLVHDFFQETIVNTGFIEVTFGESRSLFDNLSLKLRMQQIEE